MRTSLLLAVTAGMLGAVNPCGFAMLPAYLSVLVASQSRPARDFRPTRAPRPDAVPGGTAGAVGRALACTAALTAGYVAVFGAFGLAVAPAAGWIQPRLPWLTAALGLVLAALGGWLASGRQLPTLGRAARAPALTRSLPSMALFGVAYALASLSCTVAPFLAIVVSSLRAGSTSEGIALFLAYATGMGLVVGVTALAVALLRASLLDRLRRASALVPRISGVMLALAGAYVAYYGWYELRLAANARAAVGDPVIGTALGVQQRLAAGLGQTGPAMLAALLVLLVVVGWAAGRIRGQRS